MRWSLLSNITNIKSISTYVDSYNNSQKLEFWDNFLLVADRFDGLEILDISNISNPQKISQYIDVFNRTVDLKVLDNLAIISDRADGVEIINISNPLNPMEIASYTDGYNNTIQTRCQHKDVPGKTYAYKISSGGQCHPENPD